MNCHLPRAPGVPRPDRQGHCGRSCLGPAPFTDRALTTSRAKQHTSGWFCVERNGSTHPSKFSRPQDRPCPSSEPLPCMSGTGRRPSFEVLALHPRPTPQSCFPLRSHPPHCTVGHCPCISGLLGDSDIKDARCAAPYSAIAVILVSFFPTPPLQVLSELGAHP